MNLTWNLLEFYLNLTWILLESYLNLTWILLESCLNLTWILPKFYLNLNFFLLNFYLNLTLSVNIIIVTRAYLVLKVILKLVLILLQLISQDIMLFIITQITNCWKMVGPFSKLKKNLLNLFTLQIQIGEYPTST